jgi:hypothetical protein
MFNDVLPALTPCRHTIWVCPARTRAGSYIALSIPGWVTQSLLFLCMLPMTWRMAVKACALWRQESTARSAAAAAVVVEAAAGQAGSRQPLVKTSGVTDGSLNRSNTLRKRNSGRVHAADTTQHEATSNNIARLPAAMKNSLNKIPHATAADLEAGRTCKVNLGARLDLASTCNTQCSSGSIGATGYSSIAGVCWGALERMGCACVLGRIWPGDVTPAVVDGGGGGAAAARGDAATELLICRGKAARVQAALLAEQSAQLPPLQVGFVVLILSATSAGAGGSIALPCGTPGWWAASLCSLPLMLAITAAERRHMLWKSTWRKALGLSEKDAYNWDAHRTLVLPAFCIIGGLLTGMLGLSSSFVIGPLLLELGVQPDVSVASTQVRGAY